MSASSNDGEEIVTTEIRLPVGHVLWKFRDHHVMEFLRAQASDTDLGCIKVRVPALDRLWQAAFELGIEHGAAVAHAANQAKKEKRK
jgi:hypothetical protein